MDRQSIEDEARRLQFEIWQKRDLLFPLGVPSPIAMCKPEVAVRVIDLEITYPDDLGTFRSGSELYTVAGTLDRRRGVISLSPRFGERAMRFTGAHEIVAGFRRRSGGHTVLRRPAVPVASRQVRPVDQRVM
jgi:hypothetical protein